MVKRDYRVRPSTIVSRGIDTSTCQIVPIKRRIQQTASNGQGNCVRSWTRKMYDRYLTSGYQHRRTFSRINGAIKNNFINNIYTYMRPREKV